MVQHFLSTESFSRETLEQVLDLSRALQADPCQPLMRNKSIALLFFNSSMRTRTSFELGARQLGGTAIVLQPGKDAWGIEFEDGAIMDGDAEEHIQEVAGVLSQWVDLIAIRRFPGGDDWQIERSDPMIQALASHASVPVINMETIVHPCQELALMKTLQDRMGSVEGRQFLLAWTWHPRPLNTAVANSALLIASKFGMNVTLLCPDESYLLDGHFMDQARQNCHAHGTRFQVSHEIESAYADAEVVYAKSWGALPRYGQVSAEQAHREPYRHFRVDAAKMALTNQALFSHCLPLRRNIKATDEVMNAPSCVAVEEAANRLHVQKALMVHLLNNPTSRSLSS